MVKIWCIASEMVDLFHVTDAGACIRHCDIMCHEGRDFMVEFFDHELEAGRQHEYIGAGVVALVL